MATSIKPSLASAVPTISVVMSVYNGQDYLSAAIESILNQKFKDFEFIIINDGSTDSSLKIIKQYKDPRIVIISRKNKGLVASLNEGITGAQGQYIARQDADDVSHPGRLADSLKYLKKHNLTLVGTFGDFLDSPTKPVDEYVVPYFSPDPGRRLFIGNTLMHGSVLFEKEAYLKAGPYSARLGPVEDYDLWVRFDARRIAVVPRVLYSYRLNPNGISQSQEKTQQTSTEKIRQKLWQAGRPAALGLRQAIRHARKYQSHSQSLYLQFRGDQRLLYQEAVQKKQYTIAIQQIMIILVLKLFGVKKT